jgi:hypothetical protein
MKLYASRDETRREHVIKLEASLGIEHLLQGI